jgi:hypothetical protein
MTLARRVKPAPMLIGRPMRRRQVLLLVAYLVLPNRCLALEANPTNRHLYPMPVLPEWPNCRQKEPVLATRVEWEVLLPLLVVLPMSTDCRRLPNCRWMLSCSMDRLALALQLVLPKRLHQARWQEQAVVSESALAPVAVPGVEVVVVLVVPVGAVGPLVAVALRPAGSAGSASPEHQFE